MKRVVKLAFFLICLMTAASVATPTRWQMLEPGLYYTKIRTLSRLHTGYVHAFRVDLTKFELTSAIAEDERNKIASVEDLMSTKKGVVGINGGFFSQELKPLGLRLSHHDQRYPLKSVSWWGVFYIVNEVPYIVSQKQFHRTKNIEFAIQCGPRLIANNKIIKSLKPGLDSRSALGITRDKKVVLIVTENLNLTTNQLANLMKASQVDGGLDCADAINLDGGSSTQMYAKSGNFILVVPGYSAVTDAVIVVPRTKKLNRKQAYESDH